MFHNGLNYDYRFIIKKLAEKFKGQFRSSGENTEKLSFQFQQIGKNEKKLQKSYLTINSLLITQDSWQDHYQTLLIILLKEFIKLSVKINQIIKI